MADEKEGSIRRKKAGRSTAEAMAAKQRDISVSEFFAKNKHLLGFDNPRKALLTTVKEAVDNSLDACEEAGIIPEVWVRIDQPQPGRFRVAVQDNGPGIVKKQIPLIFGKLLYGSKFHRLRMSRGQQGIGISAAGMNGMLTTGKPMAILSKISPRSPLHYFLLQVDTRKNAPDIVNGKGEGIDIAAGAKGLQYIKDHSIDWVSHFPADEGAPARELESGTRVTIELTAVYKRGRGSVDEYLEQTAIANPHVTIHWQDPEGNVRTIARSTTELPREAKEIKPHPYGIELGRLITLLSDDRKSTLSSFLTQSFSCVTPAVARKICEAAKLSPRNSSWKVGQGEAERLYQAMQETRIRPPSTDCIVPIGQELLLKGLKAIVPGEFHDSITRPPTVYRGSPFQIEVALAYGGVLQGQKISRDELLERIQQSDARTLRKFLVDSFAGMNGDAADKILEETKLPTRGSPRNLGDPQLTALHQALHAVNTSEGQSMQVYRFANRVPLQFQPGACAITQAVLNTNWRAYGLSQSRGSLPSGPLTLIVHIASVWVPFTSESKEAVASYPEIEKELRLAIQAVGRNLAGFLRKRQAIQAEGNRRTIFLRYLREVAEAVATINKTDPDPVYQQLLRVAKRKTSVADLRLDEFGSAIVAAEQGGDAE
ncbi:MAG: ATP-binding protein, partial [Pirellulaceae bacterium]